MNKVAETVISRSLRRYNRVCVFGGIYIPRAQDVDRDSWGHDAHENDQPNI